MLMLMLFMNYNTDGLDYSEVLYAGDTCLLAVTACSYRTCAMGKADLPFSTQNSCVLRVVQ